MLPSMFLSLFLFYFFFTFPSSYAIYANQNLFPSSTSIHPKQHPERLIRSHHQFPNNDNNIANDSSSIIDAPRIHEKKSEFSSLPNAEASIAYLGQHAGYYSLPHTHGARMFYFFFKSRNSENDPIVIWLSGGPGFSSSVALFYENGPFHIREDLSLIWNEYGWDKVSNILFVDQPIGTGFSYTVDDRDIRHNQIDISNDLYIFLQKFFQEHPQFVRNDFLIAGQSYAGHYAPALATRILQGNQNPENIQINLKGFAVGNGLTNPRIQYGLLPQVAQKYNLIPDSEFPRIKGMLSKCKTSAENCDRGMEDACLDAFNDCDSMFQEIIRIAGNINYFDIRKQREGQINYDFSLAENFLNNQSVKSVLGAPDTFVFVSLSSKVYEAMKRDFMKNYDVEIPDLLDKGIKFLNYVGEYDLICNFIGNLKWVVDMQWYGKEGFKNAEVVPFMVEGNEVGALRSHGLLSFLKVYDAGHMVPMDQPKIALEMIQKWMQGELK